MIKAEKKAVRPASSSRRAVRFRPEEVARVEEAVGLDPALLDRAAEEAELIVLSSRYRG